MSELEQVLAGDSAHTPPANILEDIPTGTAYKRLECAPHSIYEELWHIAFWQKLTLDWVRGIETPIPEHASSGFPQPEDVAGEAWDQLRGRFLCTLNEALTQVRDSARLDVFINCPSRPGMPVRVMTVRDQLESLGAHNAYHFGRIVLLRQMLGLWPPPSGGFNW